MGAGSHGGFGNTRGKGKSSRFTPVCYEGTVTVGGIKRDVSRRVYQRQDIDFGYYDAISNRTNIQRMLDGDPPIGQDGRPTVLHHVLQKEVGPMVEVREVTHHEYQRILHGLGGPGMSFRNDPDLEKQYNNFRKKYWRWRARQILKGESR